MKKIALISIVVVAMLCNTCFAAYARGELNYIVKPGDTLYGIGHKYGLPYRLVMKINKLESVVIRPGMKLTLAQEKGSIHLVQPGDTLYALSRRYAVTITEIKQANGLDSAVIHPDTRLMIPSRSSIAAEPAVRAVSGGGFSFTGDDINLLARLIHAEARGESLKGQIAVGAVIINRLASGSFPGNIREIVFQRTKGVYQFTPVQDGQISLEPDSAAYYAAERALKGEDPTNGALFFYNPETSSDEWIRTLPVTTVIGNHVFAK